MTCKHELENLMGTADGFTCRACGMHFATYKDWQREAGLLVEEAPKPKKARKKKEETPDAGQHEDGNA